MATSEQLLVRIDATTEQLRRQMAAADKTVADFERKTQGSFKALDATFQKFNAASRVVAGGLAAIGVGLSVRELGRYADAWRSTNNQLVVATGSTAAAAKATEQLFQVAQRTRSGFEGTAQLYARLSLAGKELGATSDQLIKFTEGVGKAIAVSGGSASSASGSLLQLSQALGGGTVRAEEFNSVLEGSPRIIQAVADGLDKAGGSVSKLRELVKTGEVSSQAFFSAFLTQLPKLDAEFSTTQSTIGQSLTTLDNSLSRLIGRADEFSGFSSTVASAIRGISSAIDDLAGAGNGPRFVFGEELEKARQNAEALRLEIERLEGSTGRAATRERQGLAIRLGALEAVDAFRELGRLQDEIAAKQERLASIGNVRGGQAQRSGLAAEIADLEAQAIKLQTAIDQADRAVVTSATATGAALKPVSDNLTALQAKLFGLEGSWEAFGRGGRDALDAIEKRFTLNEKAADLAEKFNAANKKAIESGAIAARQAAAYLPVLEDIADAEERRTAALLADDYLDTLAAEERFARDRLLYGEAEAEILKQINELRAAGVTVTEGMETAIRRATTATVALNDEWTEGQKAAERALQAAAAPRREYRLGAVLDNLENAP
ncbi:MAG: tape measure protein [Thalassobaculum sp.]|uniref:tape measure protein n=1 Tax=Thalassobaculum sp. TaxID=2022740 RepID=UPI0032EB6EBB